MTTTDLPAPRAEQLSRHTPGPWEWGMYTTPDEGMVISVVTTDHRGINRTVCRVSRIDSADTTDSANAALIADAPVLLGVLRDLLRELGAPANYTASYARAVNAAQRLVDSHT